MGSITIFGGQDTSVLIEAAARAAQAANCLASAAQQLVLASQCFSGSARAVSLAGNSLGISGLGVFGCSDASTAASARQQCADEASRLAYLLGDLGGQAEGIGRDLLQAEAVYVTAESAAMRLVAGATRWWAGLTGFLGSTPAGMFALGAAALPVVVPLGVGAFVVNRATSGRFFEAVTPAVVRAAAPYTDDLMAGFGWGIAAAHPGGAKWDFSVRGAAAAAVGVARAYTTITTARVTRLAPNEFTRQANSGSGTIAAALRQLNDLHSPRPISAGIPPGTVAVQRVVQLDGSVSWTVLVPGTQTFAPGANPLDALSDIEIVGTHACDATLAVEAALAAAGAQPGEPVVLFGHSLGGMVVMALAESDRFRERHPVAGVVTAGSPTADFLVPQDIPIINLENRQELVSNLEGKDAAATPVGPIRLVIAEDLAVSTDPLDQAAAGSISAAHALPTHARTWDDALALNSPRVEAVSGLIEPMLSGAVVMTTLYTATRVTGPSSTVAPIEPPSVEPRRSSLTRPASEESPRRAAGLPESRQARPPGRRAGKDDPRREPSSGRTGSGSFGTAR